MYNNETKLGWIQEALNDIYGKEQIDKTVNIIEGKEFFVNRNLHRDYNNMLSMFDNRLKREAFYNG